MRVNDAISGLVLLVLALGIVGYATTFPSMPGQRFGPALFPTLIGTGLGIAGLVLIVSGLMRVGTVGWVDGEDWLRSPQLLTNAAAILLALVVYILAAHRIGFIPIAFAITAGLMIKLSGGRVLSSLAMAALATFAVYYVFGRLLLVPLPGGLLRTYGW